MDALFHMITMNWDLSFQNGTKAFILSSSLQLSLNFFYSHKTVQIENNLHIFVCKYFLHPYYSNWV